MEHSEALLEHELYVVKHISQNDLPVISSFRTTQATGGGLEAYLKRIALSDELSNRARTYLVLDKETEELVAYFSLKAGMVATNEKKRIVTTVFDMEPGVELSNFAVNALYQERHPEARGIGRMIFREIILPIVNKAAKFIGVDILYLYALPYPTLIDNYHNRYGFDRLPLKQERRLHRRQKPRYDASCIFMYMILPGSK